jgi:hypothetical protein
MNDSTHTALQQELAALKRVNYPQSFGTPDLPWESASAVLGYIEIHPHLQLQLGVKFGLLMDGKPRPTTRAAKWYWRLFLAAPDAPVNTRGIYACIAAFAEITRQKKVQYLYQHEIEDWLLFQPWTRAGESDKETKKRKKFLEMSLDFRRNWVEENKPFPENNEAPTALELVELGIRPGQWEEYQKGNLTPYVEENDAEKSKR